MIVMAHVMRPLACGCPQNAIGPLAWSCWKPN
jgi:hypothetical protein